MELIMNNRRLRSRHATAHPSPACRERGVVMFIALLVMVALSLAGIALIRSADTATIVSGNLAFKQAAVYAVDRSVEQAIAALFDPPPAIVDKTADLPAQNYYACVLNDAGTACLPPNSPIPEIPLMLTTKAEIDAAISSGKLTDGLIAPDAAGNRSYYVIER
ncbi:MAG: pilus assembly PilX N-terminal domain-containing protein, partial [Casimicrobiaceae bacterium]